MIPKEYFASPSCPYAVSCGGVVFRGHGETAEYALLYREEGEERSWHLPKGTLHADESLLSCALREIKEETGIEADVVSYIGIRQAEWAGTQGFLIDKTVHYFLCKYLSDETGMDQEHDGLEWLLFADAHTNLATNEKAEHLILERAHKEVSLLTE